MRAYCFGRRGLISCVLSIVLSLLTACGQSKKQPAHQLSLHNFSAEILKVEIKGIRLYAIGGGPQDLGGTIHPGLLASYDTLGPIILSPPIDVKWRAREGNRSGEKSFAGIPGVKGSRIEIGGVLAIGIMPDFEIRIAFVPALHQDEIIENDRIERALFGDEARSVPSRAKSK